MATGVTPREFRYPKGAGDKKEALIRDKELRKNKDTLYCARREGEIWNLMFQSTLMREWLSAIKEKYPELEESQQDNLIKLKSNEGTISFCTTVKVMVHGKQL